MIGRWLQGSLLLLLLLGLPLVGVGLTGKPFEQYLELPPLTHYVKHAPFSWQVFWAGVIVLTSLTWFCINMLIRSQRLPSVFLIARKSFPWWGWVSLGWTGLCWWLAWSRLSWFEPWQLYTFTPLWMGCIVTVNAWTYQRTGRSLLTHRPWYFLGLFPLSAAFWWFFEYLNRFVQNWYYFGGEHLSATEYVLHASYSFSTVLPAVMSIRELWASVQLVDRRLRDLPPWDGQFSTAWGFWLITLAGTGLVCIGVWPDVFFPLVWVAPLLLILGFQMLRGEQTIVEGVREGDWRGVGTAALAGLTSGFLWELWNFNSLARWEYAIPYVYGYHIFEMPLLGYVGYLPFGLECVVVAMLLERSTIQRVTGP